MIVVDPTSAIRLYDVSWSYYQRTLEELERTGGRVRVTFDRGTLEMMMLSTTHESVKSLIGRLIEIYALEADVPAKPLGSVTCQREDLLRGIEPDECYYVTTEPPPDTGHPLDLDVYAPPDLAIEVDVTNSTIPKQPIYGAIGVPEVWRLDGQQVVPMHRREDGTYEIAKVSLAFPLLPLDRFNAYLARAMVGNQHEVLKAFRDWVRAGSPP